MDVLLLREGEHLLETFFASQAGLLEAAEWRTEEVLAHFIDPHEARLHSHGGTVRGV